MAQFMDDAMFERYKNIESGGTGHWTIARAINTGTMFPRAYMGIHAGDAESYDTFIDIYKPCVEGYHKGFVWDLEHAHKTDLNPDHLSVEFTPQAESLILSTRIRVARNLGGDFVMNPNGTAESRIAVLDMVRAAAVNFEEDLQGTVYAHASMTPAEEKALIDDHFLFKVYLFIYF
jgi:creatine kinase